MHGNFINALIRGLWLAVPQLVVADHNGDNKLPFSIEWATNEKRTPRTEFSDGLNEFLFALEKLEINFKVSVTGGLHDRTHGKSFSGDEPLFFIAVDLVRTFPQDMKSAVSEDAFESLLIRF